MKTRLVVIIAVFSSSFSVAQSYRYFNFFNYDPKLINPAFAGLLNNQDYQVQYSIYNEKTFSRPYIALTAASLKVDKLNSGIGAIVWRDVFGAESENSGSLLYNYQFKLGTLKYLSIGTQLGYTRIYIDASHYRPIQLGDKLIVEGTEHRSSFVGDFGVAFQSNKFHVGISTINLIQKNEGTNSNYFRSYTLYSDYEFELAPSLRMKPSVLIGISDYSKAFYLNDVFIIKGIFLLGTGLLFDGDGYKILNMNTGVMIIKKIQIMLGTSFSPSINLTASYQKIDVMLRFRIPNKNLLTQN